MSEQINAIRKRHAIETRYETFECRDINNAVNQLVWRLGDKHLNPLVNSDRAYLLNHIAELEAALEQEKKYDIEKQRDIWADNCKKAWSQRDAAIARYERAEATIDSLLEDVRQACGCTDADDIRSHLEEYL